MDGLNNEAGQSASSAQSLMDGGTPFGELVEEPKPEASNGATPDKGAETTPAATDGGSDAPAVDAEAEVPGILKEPTDDTGEADDKPDLSLDKDLEGHPVLKAKWEAFVAQKEKGIQKFITENSEKLKEAQTRLDAFDQGFADIQSGDPVRAWRQIDNLIEHLEESYGPYPGRAAPAQAASQTDGDEPKSKYGLDFPSDDKIVDTMVPMIENLLDKRLGPIAEDFGSRRAEQEALSKANAAMPRIEELYTVSSDKWVTPAMVAESIKEYPDLDPVKAFAAHKAREIALFLAKHSGGNGKPAPKPLPSNEAGGRTRSNLSPGADFGEIVTAEATFG